MLPELDHILFRKKTMCLCIKTCKVESHNSGVCLGDACASAFFPPSGFCMLVSTATETRKKSYIELYNHDVYYTEMETEACEKRSKAF